MCAVRPLVPILCAAVSIVLLAESAKSQGGRITVTVTSPAGLAAADARVFISARPIYDPAKPTPTQINVGRSATTNFAGTAVFSAVPQGAYTICAQQRSSELVDACEWLNQPQGYYVTNGEALSVSIALKQGKRILVQVNDPLGLLASEKFLGQNLDISASALNGHWLPMAVSKGVAGGRQFSLVVPVNTDLRLHIRSRSYWITGASGETIDAVSPTSALPIRISSAASSVGPIILNISGVH